MADRATPRTTPVTARRRTGASRFTTLRFTSLRFARTGSVRTRIIRIAAVGAASVLVLAACSGQGGNARTASVEASGDGTLRIGLILPLADAEILHLREPRARDCDCTKYGGHDESTMHRASS